MSKTLNIAFCLPILRSPDSKDTSILQQMLIASGLRARGHHLTFMAPWGLDEVIITSDQQSQALALRTWTRSIWFRLASTVSWKTQQILKIPYLNVFSNYRFYDAYIHSLQGYDLVHERNGMYRMAVAMACKRLNLPYIFFFDGDDVLEQDFTGRKLSGILRKRAAQIIRYNLTTANRVICVSEIGKKRLMTVWQVSEDKIAVFPNGVDVQLYRPDPLCAQMDRAALGFADNPMVVFVGSFFPWQDMRVLLEAFKLVLAEMPNARLVMVGDGERYQETKGYAAKLGIDDFVQFPGFLPQTQVSRWINAADITVAPYAKMAPSLFIGSPMKLFEYMASGKAVVASGIGQINEIIEDGKNGLCYEPGNARALANALLKLLQNPEMRQELGLNAREDAVRKYSWEDYHVRLERLYETVIVESQQSRSPNWGRERGRPHE